MADNSVKVPILDLPEEERGKEEDQQIEEDVQIDIPPTDTEPDSPRDSSDIERGAGKKAKEESPSKAHVAAIEDEVERTSSPMVPRFDYKGESARSTPTKKIKEPAAITAERRASPKESGDEEELPDLGQLLTGLENGKTQLDTEENPPSLFDQPELEPKYQHIDRLKIQMEEERMRQYLSEFEQTAQDDVLMIGSISLEEVQEEEKRLRDEHMAYVRQEETLAREKQAGVLVAEEGAKRRVAAELRDQRKQLQRKREIARQKEKMDQDRLNNGFRRAENQMVTTLKHRRAEVKTMYGDLTVASGEYGGAKGRRWKVDWNKTPQPVQIKLKSLQGIKDKLPGGRYVVLASLYNRLGGDVMRWSNLRSQRWGAATLPIVHQGHFYDHELKIDQSVFTVLPPKPSLRPGMILIFEVLLLRGSVLQTDRVVSWGCFPICDGSFEVIEGKYKLPLLRGEMDSHIDKHAKIEELMASDVDHWLSNLYFEVIKLPRYLAGQKEFEVELQFTSGLINHPDRVATGDEEYKDGEVPVPGSAASRLNSRMSAGPGPSTADLTDTEGQGQSSLDEFEKKMDLDMGQLEGDVKRAKTERPMTTYSSRLTTKQKKVDLDLSSGTEAEDDDDIKRHLDEDDMFPLNKGSEEFKPVKGQPGLFYKKHLNNPVDIYARNLYTMLPKTALLAQKKKHHHRSKKDQLAEHHLSVQPPFSGKGRLERPGSKRMSYVGRQLLSELGLSQIRSREFWVMLLLFIMTFFIRIYLHYVAQWILLMAYGLPLNKFDLLPYTVRVNYQPTLLHSTDEMFMVLCGPLLIFITFIFLVLFSWISQLALGSFPDIGSKFVVAFGLQALLDPLFILLIDCAMGTYLDSDGSEPIADAAKLYWHFYRNEGSGVGGILVTLVLYAFVIFASASVLYMYFLRLHNNGRMLDIYWRLHASEEELFIPQDLELSNQELHYICRQSEQWRGQEGDRRKVAVYDYIWDDKGKQHVKHTKTSSLELAGSADESRCEITTHVAIYTVYLDGLRELYRQFLRLPDGAVIEVFDGLTALLGTATDTAGDTKEPLSGGSGARLRKGKAGPSRVTQADSSDESGLEVGNRNTSHSTAAIAAAGVK